MASVYTDQPHPPSATRLASVESFRVVAMLIVVCIHANFLARLHVEGGDYGFVIDFPLYLLWWLTVPYFFLVAGYFYGQKVQGGQEPLPVLGSSCVSLLWLYLIWSAIYAVIPRHWVEAFSGGRIWQILSSDTWPAGALEQIKLIVLPWPPYYHMWFLPALMVGLTTVAIATLWRLEKRTMPLLVALYVFVIGAEVLQPRTGVEFNPIRAVSLAMFFTLLGWWVSYRRPVSARLAVSLIIGGSALAVAEGIVLKTALDLPAIRIAFYPYAGAALLVLGLFLLLLSKPTWGQHTILPALARYTLGVYVGHILIEHTLAPIHDQLPHLPIVWYVPYVITVYGLSLLLTWVLMQIPWLRALVVRDKSSPAGGFERAWLWARFRWSHARFRQS